MGAREENTKLRAEEAAKAAEAAEAKREEANRAAIHGDRQ